MDNLLALLYKKTRLEDTFSVNMLAIADGRPETLGLKSIIEYFLDFQYDLTTRKYQKLLARNWRNRKSRKVSCVPPISLTDHRNPAWQQEYQTGQSLSDDRHYRRHSLQEQGL